MADELTTKRIINLPAESAPDSGDVLVVDNQNNGTKKLPVSYFENEINGKIPKPTGSPNGVNGQLLRTNGDGTTDWTDYAAPTDEQVNESVEEWLDEHPEATTTVQDWSLTADKLVKGALGNVIPQQFGAKGDGITDDSQALKNCIDYAMANNYAVYIPMGTYIVTHGVLTFSLADGQSLVIIGDGQNTVIKRKDNSLSGKWSQIFTIIVQPVSVHANDVIFSNFCIDGNRRNQGEIASDSYAYEMSANISVRNGDNLTEDEQYIDRFIVSHLRFYDPVADCVNVSGSTNQLRVRDIFLNHIVSTDRHGTRNDIGITGNPMHLVHISDCDCDSIHFEYNADPPEDEIIPYIITGCRFGVCTLGARIDLHLSECVITDAFGISSFKIAKVSNCDIKISTSGYTVYSENGKCEFNNCLFRTATRLKTDETEEVASLYVRSVIECTIKNCDFVFIGETLNLDYDGDEVMDHIQGAGLAVEQSMLNPVIIDNCNFDAKYQYSFSHTNNYIIARNLDINTAYLCQQYSPNSQYLGAKLIFENVRLGNECTGCLGWGNIPIAEEAKGAVITLEQNFNNTSISDAYLNNWYANVSGDFHREVKISGPLTLSLIKTIASTVGYQSRHFFRLIKGDTFIYNGENPQLYPDKWVITDDGQTVISRVDALVSGTALEERIATSGSGYGATANRPVCYLSKGFTYFDTDLNKPIFWTGTGWVDITGTTV